LPDPYIRSRLPSILRMEDKLEPLGEPAAARDPKLYRLLSIVDALRIGRARDRQLAVAELRECL
jgi:hypothetical protein